MICEACTDRWGLSVRTSEDTWPCKFTNGHHQRLIFVVAVVFLPVSLHPVLLGRTSAQTTQGLGTGFGGHSSKGLPFSNMLQDKKHKSICQVVWFQTDILNDWPIAMTASFSYRNPKTEHLEGVFLVWKEKTKRLLCWGLTSHTHFLLCLVALLNGCLWDSQPATSQPNHPRIWGALYFISEILLPGFDDWWVITLFKPYILFFLWGKSFV